MGRSVVHDIIYQVFVPGFILSTVTTFTCSTGALNFATVLNQKVIFSQDDFLLLRPSYSADHDSNKTTNSITMKPLLPILHQGIIPSTGLPPAADGSIPKHIILFKIYLNIILPFTLRPSKWLRLFGFSNRNNIKLFSFIQCILHQYSNFIL